MILEVSESVSVRIAAISALKQADEKKCLTVLQELLSRPIRSTGVATRMVSTESSPAQLQMGLSEEPELLVRECLLQLGSMEGPQPRTVLVQLLHDRKMPLSVRQFAFDVIHAAGGGKVPNFTILKIVSYMK